MKEKTIVSAVTLIASLASYLYAKNADKDAVPYVMIGGFVGAIIGEAISKTIGGGNDNNPPSLQAA